jgi:hypothetical protein
VLLLHWLRSNTHSQIPKRYEKTILVDFDGTLFNDRRAGECGSDVEVGIVGAQKRQ